MDIKITEVDDYSDNYWETSNVDKPKKKKVSFNDILSNMNLVVNKQGVLQMMAPNQQLTQQMINNDFSEQPTNYQYQNYAQEKPIEPVVKHSYIYNKYFKDYNDHASNQPNVRIPKTIEEYKQMLEEDRIKAIEHKKMIEQVKSKKMFFTANSDTRTNPRNIQASTGGLRKMTFN